MKKFIGLLVQGMLLGLVLGLCLAGLAALFYRRWKGMGGNAPVFYFASYFLVVGGLLGSVGGWCLALQMILGRLLDSLIRSTARLVPLSFARVEEGWLGRIEVFAREVLGPMPSPFRRMAEFLVRDRFSNIPRANRALEKAGKKHPLQSQDPEWLAAVALHYFLGPVWAVFYGVYVILLLIACFFWSLPFIR